MKHLSASFTKLAAAVACAFTLGSCARSEYVMLPKTASYHGDSRVATAAPATQTPAATTLVAAESAVAATLPESLAVAPAATSTPEVAQATLATIEKPSATVVAAAPSAATATVATTVAPRKLNLVQRLAVAKVTKQLKKAAGATQFKEKSTTAEAQKISGYLRTGIILLLVGLLVGIFSHLIGTIIALIGVIFIVLWLLDNL